MSRPFLEAWNWNIENVKKMLEETLKWISVFKPEEIRWVSWLQLSSKLHFLRKLAWANLVPNVQQFGYHCSFNFRDIDSRPSAETYFSWTSQMIAGGRNASARRLYCIFYPFIQMNFSYFLSAGGGCCWRWDWKGLQGKFSQSWRKVCYHLETRNAGTLLNLKWTWMCFFPTTSTAH